MLALLRLLVLALFILVSGVVILAVCLCRPFNPSNTYLTAQLYGAMHRLLGVRLAVSGREHIQPGSCVYIANHQSNYDIFLFTACVPDRTVSVGKRSIILVPVFGLIYWLSGNIFINRRNTEQAVKTLDDASRQMIAKHMSIWIFPEGTRNLGRGLGSFKTGAFHLARNAGVPIVPVCVSSYYNDFQLNRLNNGVVRVHFQPPLTEHLQSDADQRELAQTVRTGMQQCIAVLDKQ